jgi:hypothetical protein
VPYAPNPFLERRSDRTTSDQEFVSLFSPKILERLPEEVFEAGVHVFYSPPGAGKTTLLRAFSPGALRGFWNARKSDVMSETLATLEARHILDRIQGPQVIGVMLSCAAGYADLPPGADFPSVPFFRALFDCRLVLRTLRGLPQFFGYDQPLDVVRLELSYGALADELKFIPPIRSVPELQTWAEKTERQLYSLLDNGVGKSDGYEQHVRFEGPLWLEAVSFKVNGTVVAPKRLLMVDDLHKLREAQRQLLIEELTECRLKMPIWLAQRSVALGPMLLAQGGRQGRDLSAHSLDDLWASQRGQQQFVSFAESVLDRRMVQQSTIPSHSFRSHLRVDLSEREIAPSLSEGIKQFNAVVEPLKRDPQYAEWLSRAQSYVLHPTFDGVKELYRTRIEIARNQRKKQMRLDLAPLSTEELEDGDSKDDNAAEIFMHEELGIPYFYGFDRLGSLASSNVEELLQLAAVLYEGLKTKQVLRHREPVLAPLEQEKLIRDAAKKKLDFIPRTHTEGTRAQRFLMAMGAFCRGRTFEPNAPYAPGVTGIKLSDKDTEQLKGGEAAYGARGVTLVRVIAECVAENLLLRRPTAATTNRDAGSVFYLNRTLCAHFGLPLQFGGWQDVDIQILLEWMERGPVPLRHAHLQLK